jgi:O-methyltransferase involved in polyketide biosynthesis
MELNNESKTLFIPLLGKAIMSKDNLFLHDPKAEEIISKIDYDFNLLKQSKWLSMYMSVRALIIDELCNKYIEEHPNATIIHLGCGLDSRCLRINQNFDTWYDIDYENVIDIRKKFYEEDSKHKMIGNSVVDYKWLEEIN